MDKAFSMWRTIKWELTGNWVIMLKLRSMRRRGPLRPESAAGDKNGQESKGGKKKLSLVLPRTVSSLFFFTKIPLLWTDHPPLLSSMLLFFFHNYMSTVLNHLVWSHSFTSRLDFEYGEDESRDPPLALDALRCWFRWLTHAVCS